MILVVNNVRYIAEDYVIYALALEDSRSLEGSIFVERVCDELDGSGRLLEEVNNKALKMKA